MEEANTTMASRFGNMLRELRYGRHRKLYLVTIILTILLSIKLGNDFSKTWGLAVNRTDSLPDHIFFMEKTVLPGRGDYIVFVSDKPPRYFPAEQKFVKIVGGMSGDVVFVYEGKYAIRHANDGSVLVIGEAQEKDSNGRVLVPVKTGLIPDGHYFVYGLNPKSFDSRYAEMGLIPENHVIAKAHPIF